MNTRSTEAEILDFERQFWQAIQDRDVDAALEFTDESCLLTGPSGAYVVDARSLAAMMKTATYKLNHFTIEAPQVRFVRDDVAIVAYKVHEELTVDGVPVVLDAADASTWVWSNDRWRCVLHSEALAGDPFGRDHIAAPAADGTTTAVVSYGENM